MKLVGFTKEGDRVYALLSNGKYYVADADSEDGIFYWVPARAVPPVVRRFLRRQQKEKWLEVETTEI